MLDTLFEILLNLVKASQLDDVYCIVDALDENDRESVVELLEKLVERLKTLRVPLTSRY